MGIFIGVTGILTVCKKFKPLYCFLGLDWIGTGIDVEIVPPV